MVWGLEFRIWVWFRVQGLGVGYVIFGAGALAILYVQIARAASSDSIAVHYGISFFLQDGYPHPTLKPKG